jgi:translation initiation factor 1
MPPKARLVYSTDDPGAARKPPAASRPSTARAPASKSHGKAAPPAPTGLKPGVVYVERSRKGRGGKTVTLVLNLPLGEADKAALLKDLKAACGAGGALKDGVLEVQGDHRDRLLTELERRGYTVKPRGG